MTLSGGSDDSEKEGYLMKNESNRDKIMKFDPDPNAMASYLKHYPAPKINIVKDYLDKWLRGGYQHELIAKMWQDKWDLNIIWKNAEAYRNNSLHADRIWLAIGEPGIVHYLGDELHIIRTRYGDCLDY